ncbi:hypothetical protein C1H46_005720 [Malus baccata]|uniref:Uncharacterized protein n=1 Tax=Malus baccata TaxID=106549 RepID=A0A540NCI0_MALBA|nr:hypothetical protein C1H46_005720 [Malus baccata]
MHVQDPPLPVTQCGTKLSGKFKHGPPYETSMHDLLDPKILVPTISPALQKYFLLLLVPISI